MVVDVKFLHPLVTMYHVGQIPFWLSEENPKTAAQQINDGYPFGGWRHFEGFVLREDNTIKFPGDPAMKPIAEMKLREELILVYQSDWVAIIQPDRTFEICRID